MAEKKRYQEINDIKVRNSRKMYILLYLMMIVLVGVIIYIQVKGMNLNQYAFWAALVFIILIFKYTELHRLFNSYSITQHYLVHTSGFFTKHSRKIFVANISDVVLSQGVLQRLLDYGTLNVYLSADGPPLVSVKNINNPREFLEILKRKMDWIDSRDASKN